MIILERFGLQQRTKGAAKTCFVPNFLAAPEASSNGGSGGGART